MSLGEIPLAKNRIVPVVGHFFKDKVLRRGPEMSLHRCALFCRKETMSRTRFSRHGFPAGCDFFRRNEGLADTSE